MNQGCCLWLITPPQDQSRIPADLPVPPHCEDATGLQAQALPDLCHLGHPPYLPLTYVQGAYAYCLVALSKEGYHIWTIPPSKLIYGRTWWVRALLALYLVSTSQLGRCLCSLERSLGNLLAEYIWGKFSSPAQNGSIQQLESVIRLGFFQARRWQNCHKPSKFLWWEDWHFSLRQSKSTPFP